MSHETNSVDDTVQMMMNLHGKPAHDLGSYHKLTFCEDADVRHQ